MARLRHYEGQKGTRRHRRHKEAQKGTMTQRQLWKGKRKKRGRKEGRREREKGVQDSINFFL